MQTIVERWSICLGGGIVNNSQLGGVLVSPDNCVMREIVNSLGVRLFRMLDDLNNPLLNLGFDDRIVLMQDPLVLP